MTCFSLKRGIIEGHTNEYATMMEKLVIFDCDGVLVDSEVIANRIDAQALSSFGYPITTEEYIERFIGLNTKTVCQMILQESGIEIPIDYDVSFLPTLFKAFETELTSLIRPVLEIIDGMKVSRCIVSNSPRNRVLRSLELTKQLSYFQDQSIFTSQQVANGKPAPDLFVYAANQMGYYPENCIVIEDSAAGIEAALAAGMNVIGFLGGGHVEHKGYQEKIYGFNVPIARNSSELLQIMKNLLTTKIVAMA